MTTAYDIQKWERCKELATGCGVEIQYDIGKSFRIIRLSDKITLGCFNDLNEVFAYLCGRIG